MSLVRAILILLVFGMVGVRAQDGAVDQDSGAAFRIALVTAAPGDIYWQRFGHNALLVENTATGDARMYNFGIFDFEQENFLLNFARGRMLYRLAAIAPEDDLANYAGDGRSVWIQEPRSLKVYGRGPRLAPFVRRQSCTILLTSFAGCGTWRRPRIETRGCRRLLFP